MTFAAELAGSRPDEIALRDPVHEFTWAQADLLLRRIVNGLLGTELGGYRRVAVFAENSAETLLCYVGVTLAGCSAVPVNFHLTAGEAAYILRDAGARLVLADASTAERAVDAARQAGLPLVVARGGVPVPGAVPWGDWLRATGDAEPPADMRPLPSLVYTSGTTGRPKGTPLPATSFVGGDDIAEHVRRLAETPWAGYGRHLVIGPIYHSGPLTATRLFTGGVPVTVLGRFDAQTLLETIEQDRIGSTVMVPTHFIRLLALPEELRARYDCSSLKYVLQVGAKCPARVKRAMIDWWGDVVWESYGGSEVGSTCRIGAKEWLDHPGSVGRAVPSFEALVVDEHGREVLRGTEGRLYFRDASGRGIRYHNAPDKERSVHLAPGVFTLGEIGYVDQDGYVYITDRFSDMIVSGGVNIYPAEAELVLSDHPGIAEVACIGVPNPEMGEELKALAVPRDLHAPPAPASVLEYCRARLAHYKCPRSVDFLPALPRTAMGKLDKRALKLAIERKGIAMTHMPAEYTEQKPGSDGLELSLLQLLRMKGRAKAESLAMSLSREPAEVSSAVADAMAAGFCSESGASLRLTPEGRRRLSDLLAEERTAVNEGRLTGLYEEFDTANNELKAIITAWQMRGDQTLNDHTDAGYDRSVIERLAALHDGFSGLLGQIVAEAPRLAHYPARFDGALHRVLAGEHRYVAAPVIDSYHTVWFELHEELIGLLGRTRADEAKAGRAV